MTFIESWAVKRTNLIKWNKGWNGYWTFISITVTSLVTRSVIGVIRRFDEKQQKARV